MYTEYQCARVNGADWVDLKARFSSELINLYKVLKLYQYYIPFLAMFETPEYASLAQKFPRYKPHVILVQYATCKDGSLPGPDNAIAMLGKRRRFAFDLSNDDWWDRLNNDLATDAGAPGAKVTILMNNKSISGPEQVGLLYQAKPYEIVVKVDPKQPADNYNPRKEAPVARIQSDISSPPPVPASSISMKTKGIMALMNDPALLATDDAKKAIESNMMSRGARKAKRVQYAKTDIVKQPAEYKYVAESMGGAKWSHSESAKLLANQLSGAIAGYHASKKKKNAAHLTRKPSHKMRHAIGQVLQNPENFGTQIQKGESVDDMLRRRGVKDIAGAYAGATDAICQRITTANRNYLPRSAVKTEDKEVIKEHASKAYKKVLIGAGFGDWIEHLFGDGECNDLGPSAPIWPGAVIRTPEQAARFAMNYRHCCPDDHRVCLPDMYQHAVAMHQQACPCGCALNQNCCCRCPSASVCACSPCRSAAPNVVVIRTDYFSDSSDCETREPYDCEYSSSSSDCDSDRMPSPSPPPVAVVAQQQQEEAPKLVHTRDCGYSNFMEVFAVAHKHVYSQTKQVLVFAPCNDTFTQKSLTKIKSRAYASEDDRIRAYVEMCNQYVVRQIPQNFRDKVTLQSLSKRTYSLDLTSRRILNIDNERAKRFVDDHHCVMHDYKSPHANTILVPVHIKYKDVPVSY